MSTFRGVIAVLFLLVGVIGYRTDTSCGDEEIAEKKIASQDDCLKWIDQLASPNKAPFKGVVHRLPAGTTSSSLAKQQAPIAEAYGHLSDNIETALPLLAASLKDSRFSSVFENGYTGDYYCQTVGRLCAGIVDAHINVYRPVVTKAEGDGHLRTLWFEPKPGTSMETELWQRKLADLQLERIEWARQQPKIEIFTDEEWKKAIDTLDKMAKQIRETNQPIPVKHRVQFFSK